MAKTTKAVHARDLMRADVLTLSLHTPVREAVERFEEHRISGAPVIDASGRLVGFLSLRDVAQPEHVRDGAAETARAELPAGDFDEDGGWDEDGSYLSDDYSPGLAVGATAGDWMNPEVVSVAPDTPLEKVCATMLDEGVHRVLVVEQGNLCGILTTTDIVRHLAGRPAPAARRAGSKAAAAEKSVKPAEPLARATSVRRAKSAPSPTSKIASKPTKPAATQASKAGSKPAPKIAPAKKR